ncbi:MAG: M48 family metallopeptidase [Sphingomonadaceae bacterium]
MSVEAEVWHYDGRNANRWQPRLMGDATAFSLIGEGWESGPYAWADLQVLDHAGADAIFQLKGMPGWRIGFPGGAMPDEIAALLPHKLRYGGFIDRIGLWWASLVLACGAALAVFIGVSAPGWLAPLVPQSFEDNLGDAMVGDFGGHLCATPQGDAALTSLAARMDPQGKARSIEVANIPMVNAIALPGRRIVIFDGLLQQAKSPDEVAGVLGHELGHVAHRDTMAALLRQLGLSVVLGGMNGTAGSNINALLSLSYGREAEHEADLTAIAKMRAANVSPLPTADFFKRMAPALPKQDKAKDKDAANTLEKAEEAMSWFASHPSSTSRTALFAKAYDKKHSYQPALASSQWQALKTMCASDKRVKPASDFGL